MPLIAVAHNPAGARGAAKKKVRRKKMKKRRLPPRGPGGKFRKRKARKARATKKRATNPTRPKKKTKRRRNAKKIASGFGPFMTTAAIVAGGIAAAEAAEYGAEKATEKWPQLAEHSEWVGRAALVAGLAGAGYVAKRAGVKSVSATHAIYGIGAALVGREIVSDLIERQRAEASAETAAAAQKSITAKPGMEADIQREFGLEADLSQREFGLEADLVEGQMDAA